METTDYTKIDKFERCGYDVVKIEQDENWMYWKHIDRRSGECIGNEIWREKKDGVWRLYATTADLK